MVLCSFLGTSIDLSRRNVRARYTIVISVKHANGMLIQGIECPILMDIARTGPAINGATAFDMELALVATPCTRPDASVSTELLTKMNVAVNVSVPVNARIVP